MTVGINNNVESYVIGNRHFSFGKKERYLSFGWVYTAFHILWMTKSPKNMYPCPSNSSTNFVKGRH